MSKLNEEDWALLSVKVEEDWGFIDDYEPLSEYKLV